MANTTEFSTFQRRLQEQHFSRLRIQCSPRSETSAKGIVNSRVLSSTPLSAAEDNVRVSGHYAICGPLLQRRRLRSAGPDTSPESARRTACSSRSRIFDLKAERAGS